MKYGMIGGGSGAFIGEFHRKAVGLDGNAVLTAGCFSRSLPLTLEVGESLEIDKERLYETYTEMAEVESKRRDGIDFVSITTPNSSHFIIARAFLEKKGLLFAITYTYTRYPAVKQAHEIIKNGEIGSIRFIHAEYSQDWMAEPVEKDPENKQAI